MDAIVTKTLVLKLPETLINRLSVYADTDTELKFLIKTAVQDYVSKREARTQRADKQKKIRALEC